MKSKHCTACKELRPLSEFCKCKNYKDGLSYKCKACAKAKKDSYSRTRDGLIANIFGHQRSHSRDRGYAQPDYTLSSLRDFMYNNVDFDRLYLNWVNSGYDKMKRPSVDRLDDYKPYTIDNLLRVCTWQENKDRGHSDRKCGNNNKNSKAVIQMTLDGEFIAEFYSARHAGRVLGIGNPSISKCCNRAAKKAGGYRWMHSLGIPIHNNSVGGNNVNQ